MRIGITGVAGMLGSHLAELLLEEGHEVVGIDDLSVGQLVNLEVAMADTRFRFYEFDAREDDLLRASLLGCDVIVHLAAVKKVTESQRSFDTLDVNVRTTMNVLQLARATHARVVFASTSDIYGVSTEVPFKEEQNLVLGQSLAKRWAYAASKLYCEHLCNSYHKDFDVDVVVLRYFGGFSERSSFAWSGGHVPIFIRQIMDNAEVTIHGDGMQTRSMAHARDLAYGTLLAIKTEPVSGEIINIGNDEELSVLDTAYLIAEVVGKAPESLHFRFIPEQEIYGAYRDLRRRLPDLTKAKRLLGFAPTMTLRHAIQVVVDARRNGGLSA